jgi:hypothetical protein
MCAACKKYGLDHSTISADLNYCLHEVSSEKECFNGVRDKGRAGKTIDYSKRAPFDSTALTRLGQSPTPFETRIVKRSTRLPP